MNAFKIIFSEVWVYFILIILLATLACGPLLIYLIWNHSLFDNLELAFKIFITVVLSIGDIFFYSILIVRIIQSVHEPLLEKE